MEIPLSSFNFVQQWNVSPSLIFFFLKPNANIYESKWHTMNAKMCRKKRGQSIFYTFCTDLNLLSESGEWTRWGNAFFHLLQPAFHIWFAFEWVQIMRKWFSSFLLSAGLSLALSDNMKWAGRRRGQKKSGHFSAFIFITKRFNVRFRGERRKSSFCDEN